MSRRWPGAVAVAARGGVARRRTTTFVIGIVVLVSTAACVLALGLVVDSSSPFDAAFAAQHGADVTATVDMSRATPAQLAGSERLPSVTALSGPYREATITPVIGRGRGGGYSAPPITLVGRPSPGGPLDDLVLTQGHWPRRPGEFVLSADSAVSLPLGTRITAHGVPGSPVLTLVGVANSVGQSADGWVGTSVGETVTISYAGRLIPVRIVGEIFDTSNHGLDVLTDWQSIATADPRRVPATYDVGLRPGTSPQSYAAALGRSLGSGGALSLNTNDPFFVTLTALIALLTLLLAVVAGLGVLNTVLLHTRERVHDLGIFRALGMTPRQTIAMVICWVAGTGLAAGLVAVPAGMAAHRYVLPLMAHAGATNVPASYIAVYSAPELAILALSGLVIAIAGALLPAGWAARSAAATALRAE